jgi:transposase
VNCTPIVRHILTIGGAFLMAKFTAEEKIQAVKNYLTGHVGYKAIAKQIGVAPSVFHNWIKQYEYQGEKAFNKRYTSYSKQFKLDVLTYMNDNGVSTGEAAVIFDIASPGLIRKWRIQMLTEGIDALLQKKKGRPSMKKKRKKYNTQKDHKKYY